MALLVPLFLALYASRIAAQQPDAHQHHVAGMAPVKVPAGALYTEADVRFMQGMIAHHAQAIHMSRMAAARGADPRVLRFATKIDQSQIAEIFLMQDWLRRNGQQAPDTSSWRTMQMPGWRGVLKNDDIFKIGAYLETLAIEGANWKEGVKH